MEGFETVILVAELDDVYFDADEDNVVGSGSASIAFRDLCCVHGNCSCLSLYSALTNVTSNVLINITTDLELSSIISIVDLSNITITGHNYPTVHCNNSGGIHFMSCYNCTINGITWEGCGARSNISNEGNGVYPQPVFQLTNSANILIQNCSFQQSIGQAVILSGMSGDVNIIYCNFLYNKQYEGHGTAIHYSSNDILINSSLKLMITGCNFFHNEKAESIIYFGHLSTLTKFCEYLELQNSKFHDNIGVPIYLSNQDLHINRNAEFNNNTAENGGGIFISNHSNIIFHKSATVNFTSNTATNNGGAIFLTNHSNILFKDHCTSYQCYDNELYDNHDDQNKGTLVIFCNNTADGFGQNIYTHSSNITVGDDATVMFYGKGWQFSSHSSAIYAEYYCTVTFEGYSKVTFDNNAAVGDGGAMYISDHSTVTFEGNSKVTLNNNAARNGGAMYITHHSTITFEGNSTVTSNNNTAYDNGGVMYIVYSNTTFQGNSTVTSNHNKADNGGVMYIVYSNTTFQGNSTVTSNNNGASNGNGGVMYITYHSTITFEGNSTVTSNNNTAYDNGGVMYIFYSNITFQGNSTVTSNNNTAYDNGGVMYIDYSNITFQGNSTVTSNNNGASNGNGGVMYITDFSAITFEGNSTVTSNDNMAYDNGGVMYIFYSNITFQGNSTVTSNNNTAYDNGGVMYIVYSNTTFQGNSTVTSNNNGASNGNGGVMYIVYSNTTFQGNSTVTSNNNVANGRVVYITDYSTTTFEGNSTVTSNNNTSYNNGGVMYIKFSTTTFQGNSTVTSNSNEADIGGVMYITHFSVIAFQGNSTVTSNNNRAYYNGGVMYITYLSTVTFEGNSTVTSNNNTAYDNGGVMYIVYSNITFQGNSTVTSNNNTAYDNGGVMYIAYSNITFQGNSTVTSNNNTAYDNGGVMYIKYSNTTFQGNSTVTSNNNGASNGNGGVMYITDFSAITFEGNSTVISNDNMAYDNGGVIYIDLYSNITFKDNSLVSFSNNKANESNGGAICSANHCVILFEGSSVVIFNNNTSHDNGGALFNQHTNVTFRGKPNVTFHNNKADNNGGAFYIDHDSTVRCIGNSTVTFNGNIADLGGSIFSKSSNTYGENSLVTFSNNTALRDGGAIYCSDHSHFLHFNNASISFSFNVANDYGGAIYLLFKESSMNFNSCNIHFKENTAGIIQNSVYINVLRSCDRNCLFHNIDIIAQKYVLTTSPHKLILYNPAKCINGNDTDCDRYYMNNIMLGKDIAFSACVLDYYDQPTEAQQFSITGMNHQYYKINGSKYITVSCNHTIQGIAISGNLHSNNSYNYSMNISLYVARASESKIISMSLIVELSQCHPGFQYSDQSQQCECYEINNIISCSGSNSTIKRGYWFGIVNSKSTVTSCPNDYCDFTCCEITNGIYHLSPVRANQCKPYRSGTACGDCEKGYSLLFDSLQCVEENKCTTGQTVLVITLSLLYWIAVVVAVFVMMYFKVTVGSLYAIIYYYSIVDILLSQALFISNGLYITVNIMSSLAKLTPQFLGQLCLVQNMSGIDQQFIHYVHPTVISLILIMIIMLARRSRRVSSFVSRGIIHFICFLLLLSYTSVATTSLLLMRPLKFTNVDKVYTYLSPDIEYFNGRHLVYAITSMTFMIVFVVGFPLLLLLEPFLNSKINFIKIKPLLDQFQGCYKDKHHCFAGYYMLCRLVIILLVIVKISDDFINQYILISSCALMQLIHVLVQPYISTFLNVFDGIILQLIVIISGLSAVELADNNDETYLLVIAYLLVILPLTSFVAINLWFNRKTIINVIKDCRVKYFHKYSVTPPDDIEQPIEANEIGIIIDDNMRRNAIIVDV